MIGLVNVKKIAINVVLGNPEQIDGINFIVEIDESKFGKSMSK